MSLCSPLPACMGPSIQPGSTLKRPLFNKLNYSSSHEMKVGVQSHLTLRGFLEKVTVAVTIVISMEWGQNIVSDLAAINFWRP